jgi:anthranilate synthase component 2
MDNNGKTVVDDELLFEGLETSLKWTLSLGLSIRLYPKNWKRLFDENGQVMSLRHGTFDVRGTPPGKCVDSKRKKKKY